MPDTVIVIRLLPRMLYIYNIHCVKITIENIHGERTRAITLARQNSLLEQNWTAGFLDGIWHVNYEELFR